MFNGGGRLVSYPEMREFGKLPAKPEKKIQDHVVFSHALFGFSLAEKEKDGAAKSC